MYSSDPVMLNIDLSKNDDKHLKVFKNKNEYFTQM